MKEKEGELDVDDNGKVEGKHRAVWCVKEVENRVAFKKAEEKVEEKKEEKKEEKVKRGEGI